MSNKSRRKKGNVNPKRWAAYAAVGAATAISGVGTAEADVTHVVVGDEGCLDGVAAGTNSFWTSYIAGGMATLRAGHGPTSSGGFAGFHIAGASSAMIGGYAASYYRYVSNHSFGQVVSTVPFVSNDGNYFATMAIDSGFGGSQFLSAGTGYIAFQFDVGNGTQFGWVEVEMGGAPNNSLKVIQFAYADAGESITVGDVGIPEPNSIGLLATGAIGLLVSRRRRKAPKSHV